MAPRAMKPGAAGNARKRYSTSDRQVQPDQQNCTRRRSAKDKDADDPARKRSKSRRQNPQGRLSSQHPRKSPQSQEIADLSKPVAQVPRRSARIAEKHQRAGQEQLLAEQSSDLKRKIDGQPPRSYPTNLGAKKSRLSSLSLSNTDNLANSRVVKRQPRIEEVSLSNHDTKRPNHSQVTRQPISRLGPKEEFVNNWLSESCRSRNKPTNKDALLGESSDNMLRQPSEFFTPPRQPSDVVTLPDNSFRTGFTSRKSMKTTASVKDKDYRDSLGLRNIYIRRQDPPLELMRRAERITSHTRVSPEMDDSTVEEVKDIIRSFEEDQDEEDIKQQLAPYVIPAIIKLPDKRLKLKRNQLWSRCVPIPLDPLVITHPLPLPKPKPDLAFGCSRTAFSTEQLATIENLIDDPSGCSYAEPAPHLRFPFLSIEFKSPAKNGTLYIATNQAVGAGAIALNGNLELISRSSGAESFDFDEPQFFSVTMDDKFACVNVHWVSERAGNGNYGFHLEELSQHMLNDANSVRALQRAIKNILDHGADTRLQKICDALDVDRRKPSAEREAGIAEDTQRDMIQAQPQLPSPEQQADQSQHGQADENAPANAENHQGAGSQTKTQPRRAPRRTRATARRQGQDQANVPTKAARTRRGANAQGRD